MDIESIARKYVEYSIWWIHTGDSLYEKVSKEFKEKMKIEISKGLSEREAYNKINESVTFADHHNQKTAWEADKIIKKGGLIGWQLLCKIIDFSPDDDKVLAYIGAGPFEDWISKKRYNKFKFDLQKFIKSSTKWKTIAESSWHNPPELEKFLASLNSN